MISEWWIVIDQNEEGHGPLNVYSYIYIKKEQQN
jgi:hypothetical protein